MSWIANREEISETVHHYKFSESGVGGLTVDEVMGLWRATDDEGAQFRKFTNQTLLESPFAAFCWETPVVDLNRKFREFEFVLVDSPGLDRFENPQAFGFEFETASPGELVIAFSNLGRDAELVVPVPVKVEANPTESSGENERSDGVNYCHLASFLRTASDTQSDQLWQKVGTAMTQRMSHDPVWLSTAGSGVAWLHVRLDNEPKYYRHSPFKAC